jgi:hypothetical protein
MHSRTETRLCSYLLSLEERNKLDWMLSRSIKGAPKLGAPLCCLSDAVIQQSVDKDDQQEKS